MVPKKYNTFLLLLNVFFLPLFTLISVDAPPNRVNVGGELNTVIIETVWNSTFGGISNDAASVMIQTIDGGFAILGSTDLMGLAIPIFGW
ncbi:MAG: hypothetical protein ACXACP_01875 [Candidatus Hodarchaeales archaeon]